MPVGELVWPVRYPEVEPGRQPYPDWPLDMATPTTFRSPYPDATNHQACLKGTPLDTGTGLPKYRVINLSEAVAVIAGDNPRFLSKRVNEYAKILFLHFARPMPRGRSRLPVSASALIVSG